MTCSILEFLLELRALGLVTKEAGSASRVFTRCMFSVQEKVEVASKLHALNSGLGFRV